MKARVKTKLYMGCESREKVLGRGRYKGQEEWMEEEKEEKQQRQILLEKCQIKSNNSILMKDLFKMLVVSICQIYKFTKLLFMARSIKTHCVHTQTAVLPCSRSP